MAEKQLPVSAGWKRRAVKAEAKVECVQALIDGDGWGDDAADEWWKDKLRFALSTTKEGE